MSTNLQLILDATSGNLQFVPITSGGSGTPSAPDTSVQFNNSGTFGGSDAFTWDGSVVHLGAPGTPATSTGAIASSPSIPDGSGYYDGGTLQLNAGDAFNAFGSTATSGGVNFSSGNVSIDGSPSSFGSGAIASGSGAAISPTSVVGGGFNLTSGDAKIGTIASGASLQVAGAVSDYSDFGLGRYPGRVLSNTGSGLTISGLGVAARIVSDTGSLNTGIQWTYNTLGLVGTNNNVTYVDPGIPDNPLTFTWDGTTLTVTLATDGGSVIITTANDVVSDGSWGGAPITPTLAPNSSGAGILSGGGFWTLANGFESLDVSSIGPLSKGSSLNFNGASGYGFDNAIFSNQNIPATSTLIQSNNLDTNVASNAVFGALTAGVGARAIYNFNTPSYGASLYLDDTTGLVGFAPDGASAQVIRFNQTTGDVNAVSYTVNGNAGASGTGTVISAITIENGIITAITVA